MSTSAITDHWTRLRKRGLDLGGPTGSEQDAGYGGCFQVYERGRIYWHPSTGAHELHGSLLERYLQAGGQGVNPSTGERELGFPTSDHTRTEDGRFECATFEWGKIADVSGTPLVRLFGRLYEAWREEGGALGRLGHPLEDVTRVEGGRAAWFERGVLWHAEGSRDVLVGELLAPTLGQSALVDPAAPGPFEWLRFDGALDALEANAGLATALARGRWSLVPVGGGAVVGLAPAATTTARAGAPWLTFSLESSGTEPVVDGPAAGGPRRRIRRPRGLGIGDVVFGQPARGLQRRQLYSLAFQTRSMAPRVVSPHCLYARSDWKDFGVAHITDLHVSRRIEHYRSALRASGVAEQDIAKLNNWNDAFRDFIRYANRLHTAGLLDVILATGDLVDYVREVDDHPAGPGNFGFFEAIVQGSAPSPDPEGSPSEPLRVPVFTALGNHDYRANPYPLAFTIRAREEDLLGEIPVVGEALEWLVESMREGLSTVPGLGLLSEASIVGLVSTALTGTITNFEALNVTKPEALRLMGTKVKEPDIYGIPVVTPEEGARSLVVDRTMRDGTHYYFRHINRDRFYVVELGSHRVAMLDTRWDAGLTDSITLTVLAKLGFGSESRVHLVGGNPDSVGVTETELDLLREAIEAAGADGLVLVGMHAPPINPAKNEYPNYFRETAHPTAHPFQVLGYLRRAAPGHVVMPLNGRNVPRPDASSTLPGWPRTGTLYFHRGTVDDLLDFGTPVDHEEELARLIAGGEGDRGATLLLSGHGHKRVDYRLRWDATAGTLEFYTDFYLENPGQYYPTIVAGPEWWEAAGDRRLLVKVQGGAPPEGQEQHVTDHRAGAIWRELDSLVVPPYANPLLSSVGAAAWWGEHGPIVVQSAALGPCTNTRKDRELNEAPPGPDFQGFRLIQVVDDRIARVRYLALPELRRTGFPIPSEVDVPEIGPITPPPVGGSPATERVGADGRRVRDHRSS